MKLGSSSGREIKPYCLIKVMFDGKLKSKVLKMNVFNPAHRLAK